MPFPAEERERLLAVKGVGPTVVERLEQIGFDSLAALAQARTEDVVKHVAAMLGASCWQNSPQARAAIAGAIACAAEAANQLAKRSKKN
ncbi:MAG: helix-hairpin-helix domain-containing protein [Lysobacter sp.]|nr:helix-hairpin-helix domain-containing protein [Lysobacter sp.]